MRLLRFVSISLLIVSLAFAAATYGALPEQVPTRLDLTGQPVNSSPRSLFMWLLLPGLNLLLFALLAFLGTQIARRPHWFNFPGKERFLALPEEYRAPVVAEMRLVLEVTLVGVLLTMLLAQLLVWRVAMGHKAGALALAPMAGVLLTPVLLILVSRVTAAASEAEKRWKADVGTHRR